MILVPGAQELAASIAHSYRWQRDEWWSGRQPYPNRPLDLESAADPRDPWAAIDPCLTVDAPGQVWAVDMMQIVARDGSLFLSVVIDAYDRNLMGWSLGTRISLKGLLGAIGMADQRCRLVGVEPRYRRLISPFVNVRFGWRCRAVGLVSDHPSTAEYYGCAVTEAFFAIVEHTVLVRGPLTHQAEARMALHCFIEGWYNTPHRHAPAGYRSPIDYEAMRPRPRPAARRGKQPRARAGSTGECNHDLQEDLHGRQEVLPVEDRPDQRAAEGVRALRSLHSSRGGMPRRILRPPQTAQNLRFGPERSLVLGLAAPLPCESAFSLFNKLRYANLASIHDMSPALGWDRRVADDYFSYTQRSSER